jgi:hypothetical protein
MRTKITKFVLLIGTLFGPSLAYAGSCGDAVHEYYAKDYGAAAADGADCALTYLAGAAVLATVL